MVLKEGTMTPLPELDERAFQLTEGGHCSITLLSEGVKVATPWVVPQQPLGQRFHLHESVLKQMALALGLVDKSDYEEALDQQEAKLSELQGAIDALTAELDSTRWAAERWYASQGAVNNQRKRSRNEQKIESLEEMVYKRDQEIARLQSERKETAA